MTDCVCNVCGAKGEGALFTHVRKVRDPQGCLVLIMCPNCKSRDVDVYRVEPPKPAPRKSRLKEIQHIVAVCIKGKEHDGAKLRITTRVFQ